MIWFDWLLIAICTASALTTFYNIGEPRAPYTHTNAVVSILFNSALIIGILVTRSGP